ncbi:DeoR family transcriptional regulator [Bacillus sp. MUM 116]|uniref:DeoR/GlpR family DNA-binding transcription regulator n=1 Tax=Bacillus sp. MUM 116 TaxID=1678002 RepID=UPI0008F59489|nr:DeoR/GlpR family DNA-binding transcription regulator [Bacillus sp. MUM 116]OIK12856.1 DeoR family transcriptional regulator [Bacillus sp. MUM 116]
MSLAGEERKRKILELLEISGKVKVNELAEILKVSTETIRKYLDELQQEEKLKKVYGGAINISFFNEEPPTVEREVIYSEAKQRIGEFAANLINDNDVIAIDDGSTPLQLVKNLRKKRNITIFTTSISALSVLIDLHQQNIFTGKIIMLGGEINTTHHRVTGSFTIEMLENLYVDKYFISADGITKEAGITSFDSSKGMVTRKLIDHSGKQIVLIDHSKVGKRTHYKMADLQDIDIIVSDKEHPEDWEYLLKENNVKWLVADKK